MFRMEYDKDVWKKINVERIKEYGRRWWMNGFGINDREQEYLKVNQRMRMTVWEQVQYAPGTTC